MSFEAGKIQAEADIDTRPFQAKIIEMRRAARTVSGEKVTATADVDTAPAERKLRSVNDSMARLGRSRATATADLDTARAQRGLDTLNQRLNLLRGTTARARVELTGDTRATRQIDQVDFALRRLGLINSRPKVSLHGVEAAMLQLDRLEAKIAETSAASRALGSGGGRGGLLGSLSGLGGHAPSGMHLGIAAGLPLVGPLAGLLAGGAASFLTPTLAGGIGGGLFAKTAMSTYKTLDTTIKALTADQQRYNAATTDPARAAALAKEKADWQALGKPQQQAVTTMHRLSATWASFQKDLHPQTFRLLSTGADIARKGLGLLEPTVKASGDAIDSLASRADRSLNQPFWQHFFGDFLPGQAHRALMTLGTDLGHGVTGIANLMEKFAPLGNRLEADTRRWSLQFEQWTQGQGPSRFVRWVQQNGPPLLRDLKGIGQGVAGLFRGLAPIGQVELAGLGGIGRFLGVLADQNPGLVTALGTAYLGVAGGLKAISAVSGLAKIVGLLTAFKGGGPAGVRRALSQPGVAGGGFNPCGCGPGGGAGVGGAAGSTAKTVEEEAAAGGAAGVAGVYASTKARVRSMFSSGELGPMIAASLLSGANLAQFLSHSKPGFVNHLATGAGGAMVFGTQSGEINPAGHQHVTVANSDYAYLLQNRANAGLVRRQASSNPAAGLALLQHGTAGDVAFVERLAKVSRSAASAVAQFRKEQGGLNTVLEQTQHASKSLGDAEAHMGSVAARVGVQLTGNSHAAQTNRQALSDAAGWVKRYRDGLVASGMPLDQVQSKTDRYASSLRQQAIALYGNKTQVDKLLRSLHAMPGQVATKVQLRGEALAEGRLRALSKILNNIHEQSSITVHVNQVVSRFDRGPLTKPGHAAGGFIHGPGGPMSDSIPAWLSNGEFVVNAKATSRHLQLLHAINAHRYATGGHAGLPPWLQKGNNPSPNSGGGSGSSSGSGSGSGSSSSHGPTAAQRAAHRQATANVLAGIVDYAGLTFVSGLRGTEKEIRSAVKTMINRLSSAVRNNYLASDKMLVHHLRDARGTLIGLAREETAVGKQLDTAKQTLSRLRGDAASVRSGAVSSFLGLGDVTQASNTTSVGGLLDVEGQQVKVARAFNRNLHLLRKRGLSHDEYKALLAAGPAQAGNVVAMLAGGSRGQIRRLNRDEATLRRLGVHTGRASADYLYGDRIDHERHLVSRLTGEQTQLRHDAKRTADAVEKLVRAGLQDKGTHKALDRVEAAIGRSNKLLAQLAGTPGQARMNQRTHVKGVNR